MAAAPRTREALALVFAMTFPTAMAVLYFLALAGGGRANLAQQLAYAAGKVVQFGFPLVYLSLAEGWRPRWRRPDAAGLALGLGFGLAVAAAMLVAYFGALRDSSLLAQTPARVREKVREMGVDSPVSFLALALALSVAHSLLEEYYWRWFVFGRLQMLLSLGPALALSSVAFASHHVVVLWVYLPGKVLTGVVPAALAIAVGGGVWAYVYHRAGSLLAPWLSHLLVDAAIFVIGWDMLTRGR